MESQSLKISGVISISETLDDGALGAYQKWIVFLIALVFAMDGLANIALPIAIPSIMAEWGVGRDSFKFVMAAGLCGVAVGATFGGWLGDKIGRRPALIFCVMLFGVMTILAAFVNNLEMLALVRAIDGLGIGGALPTGMALLSESMPARRRSIAIALSMVCIPVGAFMAGGLAALVLPNYGWSMLFIVAGFFPVLLALWFIFILPESPRFLALHRHRWDSLRKLLAKYGYECSDATFSGRSSVTSGSAFAEIVSKDFLPGTLSLWAAFFFCMLASYSMFSWGPVMLMSQGFDPKTMGLGISMFNLGGIVGGIFGGVILTRFGSRYTLMLYGLGGIFCSITLGVLFKTYNEGMPLLFVFLAALGFFIAGFINVVYTLGANMYPTYIKSTGLGAGAGMGRVGAVASSFTGIAALNLASAQGFFGSIALFLLISLIALLTIKAQLRRYT